MKYLAAYTLLVVGGNAAPSAAHVAGVIAAAGGEADDAALEAFLGEVQGKDLEELLQAGAGKLKGMGGGAAAAPAAAAPAAAAKVEKPKEEEVDALDGGMSMFGGGGGGGDY